MPSDDQSNNANTVSSIKEKLNTISANITKNLLSSQQNIQRSYLINEKDFLAICQLALHSIYNKEKESEKQQDIVIEQDIKDIEKDKNKEKEEKEEKEKKRRKRKKRGGRRKRRRKRRRRRGRRKKRKHENNNESKWGVFGK